MGTRNHPLLERHAYFVTTTTAERARIFSDPEIANLFIEGLLTLRDELGSATLSCLSTYT